MAKCGGALSPPPGPVAEFVALKLATNDVSEPSPPPLGSRASGGFDLLPEVAAPFDPNKKPAEISGLFVWTKLGGCAPPRPLRSICTSVKRSAGGADQRQDLGCGFGDVGAWAKDSLHTFGFEEIVILRGNDAAADDKDVAGTFSGKRFDQLWR